MKRLIIAAMLAVAGTSLTTAVSAQVRASVTLGSPVTTTRWYNTDRDYYYLPEQGVYYNSARRVYVYQDNGNWVYGSRLPDRYKGYNWKRSHYVRVRETAPYMHHDEYSNHFGRDYRGGHVRWQRDRVYDRDHDRR